MWITPTDADIFAPDAKERLAIATIKGRDDLADCVNEAVETFRGAILSRGQALGPDGTIPSGLKHYVLGMALWHFITVGVAKNEGIQTEARKNAAKEAEEILKALRSGEYIVELPEAAVAASPRTGNWNSENKIIPRGHPVPPPGLQYPNSGNPRPYANPKGPADQ